VIIFSDGTLYPEKEMKKRERFNERCKEFEK